MEVRVFCGEWPDVLGKAPAERRDEARDIARAVRQQIRAAQSSAPPFDVHDLEVSQYGSIWGEKWVEHVGEHLYRYAGMGGPTKPALAAGWQAAAAGEWRVVKSYSGDVQGAIGETLFALYLERELRYPARSFAHLRAVKRQQFPDFEILQTRQSIRRLLPTTVGRAGGAFPAEAKAARDDEIPTLTSRLADAIDQLASYWIEVGGAAGRPPPHARGVVSLAVRHDARTAYDLVLVGVA